MPYAMLFVLVLLATATTTNAVPSEYVVHEKRAVPGNFDQRLEPHVRLPMRIGLKPSKTARESAETWLMDVSHPNSEKYGQHWSQEEVIAAFAPSEDTVDVVTQWLVGSGGIDRERIAYTDNKAWLAFDATAEEAEQLLMTEYFEIDDGERRTVGCDQYHLPSHLADHVDYITPGVTGVHKKSRQ